MPTLAQTTENTKRFLKWSVLIIIGIIIVRVVLIPLAIFGYHSLFPEKPENPMPLHGKLPRIQFPSQTSSPITLSIQTPTGTLPETCNTKTCPDSYFPNKIIVFKALQLKPTLFSFDEVQKRISRIGFTEEPSSNDGITYRWINTSDQTTLRYNVVTHEFDFTSPLASSAAEIAYPPPLQNTAQQFAKAFLGSLGLLQRTDLDDTKTKVTYLRLANNALTPASSISDAQYVQVDFMRKNIENLSFIDPDPNRSLISFLIQNTNQFGQEKIVEAHYSYQQIDQDTQQTPPITTSPNSIATYSIKTAMQAFSDLQNGNGYIIRSSNITPIAIRSVSLAYYQTRDNFAYFMPVFVFEGDNEFIAIVSAIDEQWIE